MKKEEVLMNNNEITDQFYRGKKFLLQLHHLIESSFNNQFKLHELNKFDNNYLR